MHNALAFAGPIPVLDTFLRLRDVRSMNFVPLVFYVTTPDDFRDINL